MKSKILIPVLSTLFFTASCAELGAALENANQVLGSLGGTASSQNNGKTVRIAGKHTAQYELRNMKRTVETSAVCRHTTPGANAKAYLPGGRCWSPKNGTNIAETIKTV